MTDKSKAAEWTKQRESRKAELDRMSLEDLGKIVPEVKNRAARKAESDGPQKLSKEAMIDVILEGEYGPPRFRPAIKE